MTCLVNSLGLDRVTVFTCIMDIFIIFFSLFLRMFLFLFFLIFLFRLRSTPVQLFLLPKKGTELAAC